MEVKSLKEIVATRIRIWNIPVNRGDDVPIELYDYLQTIRLCPRDNDQSCKNNPTILKSCAKPQHELRACLGCFTAGFKLPSVEELNKTMAMFAFQPPRRNRRRN